MIKELLAKVSAKQDLTFDEAKQAIDEIMSGEVSEAVISSFLTALAMKGETEEEIAGAATGMRSKAMEFNIGGHALDIVGTGGDKSNSFNISTTSAFVAAAAGVTIVKHGNRAASSKCGTADCLEALGVKIDCEPKVMKKSLDENNIAFLFAQKYHSAMRFVGPVRKQIGIRIKTLYNRYVKAFAKFRLFVAVKLNYIYYIVFYIIINIFFIFVNKNSDCLDIL
jgi:anthranilate phosphoribosyltransferase